MTNAQEATRLRVGLVIGAWKLVIRERNSLAEKALPLKRMKWHILP